MRILSKRQVQELVLYSPQHIARLEKAGQFPKRVSGKLAGKAFAPFVNSDTVDAGILSHQLIHTRTHAGSDGWLEQLVRKS